MKRTQEIYIPDRIGFVTGLRAKIGYEIALKLLRSGILLLSKTTGAKVLGTTRFPKDAIRRYSLEPDFKAWKDRLTIYPIDFRNLNAVSHLIDHLKSSAHHIDILVNNAAQTVRKPPAFYAHLINGEQSNDLTVNENANMICTVDQVSSSLLNDFNLSNVSNQVSKVHRSKAEPVSVSALMSQMKLIPEDYEDQSEFFPKDEYDYFGQQIDNRPKNSWVLKIHEVNPIEMLECQIINSVVPFMFVSKLKELMLKSPHPDRYILNVSAMEGTHSH